MIKWIKDLFKSSKVKELELHIVVLEKELLKRQEDINKTNAYWKRKMHNLKKKED
jgi:hypothetical protein